MPVTEEYVINKPRSGRPRLVDDTVGEKVISTLTRNSTTRQYSLSKLSQAVQKRHGIKLSRMTIWRWLKKKGYSSVKHTTKPGLNNFQRMKRLQFAWEHRDWTIEHWKKVIWSDETSVILGSLRGKRRVWRLPKEAYSQHCVRQRWKGKREFMFWACFAYDHKGPSYVWGEETASQTKAYAAEVLKWNKENEARLKQEWEITNDMRRINLRRKPPGKKPEWKFTKANGRWERKTKGGIDSLRYKHEVLLPLFFPFLESLPGDDWLAQEDNAASHAQRRNRELWHQKGFKTANWPPNSPDLSPIEPAWFMLKCITSKKKITSRATLINTWKKAWALFPQEKLQRLVERIPGNIQWVLYLYGNNLYEEGSDPPDLTNQQREELYDGIEFLLSQSNPILPGLEALIEAVEEGVEEGWQDVRGRIA
ncbi:hypothetical protein HIM_04514 [Hirsutella minnesotensis 3608]|uniref:Transposase Tc1-like domain-containing protein n=1 Tax=Hirsutella minnesotensis 3608 TaxID=1043627 RepID=A0A0F7ZV62_9HYPO|nr:hypothetical protein HIM_04514 [Hirsutella minnesotensis 3608]